MKKELWKLFDQDEKNESFFWTSFAIFIFIILVFPKDLLKENIGLFLIVFFVYLCIRIFNIIYTLIYISKFDENKWGKIKLELEKPILFSEHYYIVTENYLILQCGLPKIINIKDIVLIYKNFYYYSKTKIKNNILYTSDGKRHSFFIREYNLFSNYKRVDDLIYVLNKLNNNILIDNTEKNRMIIKDKYRFNIKKEKNWF